MLDKILMFFTPGPLQERVAFGPRVFYSWISVGLVLSLLNFPLYILSSPGATLGIEILIAGLMSGPLLMCLWGLIGLAINSMRRKSSEYIGWYWWLFPLATCLLISFWLTLAWFGLLFRLMGIKIPNFFSKIDHPQI